MDTFTIACVNGGKPFRFSYDNVTPAAVEAAHAAHSHALKEATRGLDKNAPDAVVNEVLDGARTAALVAKSCALVYHALLNVDPKLAQLGQDALIQQLSVDQFKRLATALKGQAQAGGADPLATPTPPPAS